MRKRSLIIGLAVAAFAAAIVFALPQSVLDAVATWLGTGALAPQAAPPLGTTARVLIAASAFAGVFLLALVADLQPRSHREPAAEVDIPERDFFADTTPYSLDPPVVENPAADPIVADVQPIPPLPEPPAETAPPIAITAVETPPAPMEFVEPQTAAELPPFEEPAPAPRAEPAAPAMPPAAVELEGLRQALGRIEADVAALRAQQINEADDLAGTLRTIQLTEALRSVEHLLREQKASPGDSPAAQLQRVEARLDGIARKIDALAARPAPAAPADPQSAQRVSTALAELRQAMARN